MTDSIPPSSGTPQPFAAYPPPPAHSPEQQVITPAGVTVGPGGGSYGGPGEPGGNDGYGRSDGYGGSGGFGDRGGSGHDGYGDTYPGAPAPRRRGPGRRTALLVAAVAVVSGLVGGGTAALIGDATHSGSTAATSVVGTPTSSDAKAMGSVAAVAAAVSPSIVEIDATSGSGESIGSGVILTSDGTILTNNHVINGSDTLKVTFSTGKTATAQVVGTDSAKDLAVIKAQDVSGLKPATLGDSGSVAVGDQVVAIGSPEGLAGTVTSGVVSALDRDVTVSTDEGNSGGGRGGDQWPFQFGGGQYNGQVGGNTTTYKAIQTDASLNPGNSGGALINMSGQVIGINSAMYSPSTSNSYSSGSAGSVGLGFAIPVNTVKADLNALENGGRN